MKSLLFYLAIAASAIFLLITILKILQIKLTKKIPTTTKITVQNVIQQWKDSILMYQSISNSISNVNSKIKRIFSYRINTKCYPQNSQIKLSKQAERGNRDSIQYKLKTEQSSNRPLKSEVQEIKHQIIQFNDSTQQKLIDHYGCQNKYSPQKIPDLTPQSKRNHQESSPNLIHDNSKETDLITELNKRLKIAYENQQLYNAEISKLQQQFHLQKKVNSDIIQKLKAQIQHLKLQADIITQLQKENTKLKQQINILFNHSSNSQQTLRTSNSATLLSTRKQNDLILGKSCIQSFQTAVFTKKQDFLKDCRFILLDQRNFIANKLKQYNIYYESAQLLFRFDHHKMLNPFQKIKGVSSLLLVLQLLNGKALAIYTHFHDLTKSNESLLLVFDLTKLKLYWSDNQQIKIQEGILSWGNQILKIRNSEPKMLLCKIPGSNLVGTDKLNQQQFLGTFKEYTQINKYEFYRINIK